MRHRPARRPVDTVSSAAGVPAGHGRTATSCDPSNEASTAARILLIGLIRSASTFSESNRRSSPRDDAAVPGIGGAGRREPVALWHFGHCRGRDHPFSVSLMLFVAPVLIGVLYAFLMSLLREPTRRRLNAIMVAGAGAAYLSSGSFGAWEFVFTAAVTYCAYRGLDSYVWIGIAWLLHTAWDALHYLRGAPIIPFTLIARLHDLRPGDRPLVPARRTLAPHPDRLLVPPTPRLHLRRVTHLGHT